MNQSRRSIPYPGIGSLFYLPQNIWDETVKSVAYYGQFRSEGLVYWGGIVDGAGGITVTSLLCLNHLPQGGCVRPTSEEMRALLRSLRERDEKLVAQIHTHLGEAFHSLGDSQKATSFHPGFISIVLPGFGRGVASLLDCAVYEFRGDFERLRQDEIKSRFAIYNQTVDLMPRPEPVKGKWRETLWNTLSQKLKFIARKKR